MEPFGAALEVPVNGTVLHCLDTGGTGPLALCLHGFPDTAHTWRHLAPALAEAGYRVVAPFMRGYAPSPVPVDGRYQTGMLAADADALHTALGADDRAVIIGHDWGAPATYGAAVMGPDKWRAVVGMAVPPGAAMALSLLGDLAQLQRSWYMFFFQHPLADQVVPRAEMAFIDMIWQNWSPGYAAAADVDAVRAALGTPEHLAAALGYYRATLGDGRRDPALEDFQAATTAIPTQPLLYLHGRDDGCIGTQVMDLARDLAGAEAPITWQVIEQAGHFCHLEQPRAIADLVLEHLS